VDWPLASGGADPAADENSSAAVARLRARRAYACRLDPARALRSQEEAAAFLADRGLLTRMPASSLPSLFGACHEEGYRPGGGGFAEWPATAYPWFGALAARDDVHELAVHAGRSVLVTGAVAALMDPLCRRGIAEAESHGGDGAALLAHLAAAGPSEGGDLKAELGWDAGRLRRVRRPLERTGAVVRRSVTLPAKGAGHTHSSVLARWDQAHPQAAEGGSLAEVLVAAVRAAVLVPEAEPPAWFTWRPRADASTIEGLVAGGRLIRPAPGWLSVP
jgi:hypothetical protein